MLLHMFECACTRVPSNCLSVSQTMRVYIVCAGACVCMQVLHVCMCVYARVSPHPHLKTISGFRSNGV